MERGDAAARSADWVPRAAIACCALGFLLVVPVRAPDWFVRYGVPGTSALAAAALAFALALVWLVLRGTRRQSRNVAIELAVCAVALLGAEFALRAFMPEVIVENPQTRATLLARRAAAQASPDHDERSRLEVVRDLRTRGIDAYPGISREWPRDPRVRRELPPGLFPLSHASRVEVVECNESGSFLVYSTDELGFNNPPGLLASGRVDLAALGESATLGHCVPEEHSVLAAVRRVYPRTANFGMAGTHTLSQLATFREYVEPLRPRLVLWFVNPDYADARDEARDPVLRRYLDPGYVQGLRSRQPEVDAAVRRLAIPLEAAREDAVRRELELASVRRVDRALILAGLRARLSLGPELQRARRSDATTGRFERVLGLVRDATASWGGQLIVVLLPVYREVVSEQIPEPLSHRRLAELATSLGIPVVNGAELFLEHDDPPALFVNRMQNHPNERGYALLADRVLEAVEDHTPPMLASRD